MPSRPDNVVDLPLPRCQDLRVPVVTGEPLRLLFLNLAMMVAEGSAAYTSMTQDDVCGWLDQLQEMLNRPELLPRFLAEAGITPIARCRLVMIDPASLSSPPPRAA